MFKLYESFLQKSIDIWNKSPNNCKDTIFKNQINKNRLITKLKFSCINGCGAEILFNDIKNHYEFNCLEKKENEEKKKNKEENVNNKYNGKMGYKSKIKILTRDEVTKLSRNMKIGYISFFKSKHKNC